MTLSTHSALSTGSWGISLLAAFPLVTGGPDVHIVENDLLIGAVTHGVSTDWSEPPVSHARWQRGLLASQSDTIRRGRLRSARHEEEWSFDGSEGQPVAVSVTSDVFDPMVELVANGAVGGTDDDGGRGVNALLLFSLPDSGSYLVRVSSSKGSGAYELRVATIEPGEQLTLSWEGQQVVSPVVDSLGYDSMAVWGFPYDTGDAVMISLTSQDFDPGVRVFRGTSDGMLDDRAARSLLDRRLGRDGDSGYGLNARMFLNGAVGGFRFRPGVVPLAIGVAGGEGSGTYELVVAAVELGASMAIQPSSAEGEIDPFNVVIDGNFLSRDQREHQWYIEGEAGRELVILVRPADPLFQPIVTLVSPDGERITTYGRQDGSWFWRSAVSLPSTGIYRVRMEGSSGSRGWKSGEYSIVFWMPQR